MIYDTVKLSKVHILSTVVHISGFIVSSEVLKHLVTRISGSQNANEQKYLWITLFYIV